MVESDIILRIVLSIIVGGAVGYEREFNNRPAGFRTNILVCVGATIVSLIQVSIGNEVINMIALNENLINVVNIDYARLGAQVISGVGFLGAGTIIHSKGSIKGLTTAASLWTVASLGLAIGMGYYSISVFGAIAIIVSLGALKRLEHRFMRNSGLSKIEIGYVDRDESIDFIKSIFNRWNIEIKDIEVYIKDDNKRYGVKSSLYTIKIYKGFSVDEMMHELIKEEGIIGVKKIS